MRTAFYIILFIMFILLCGGLHIRLYPFHVSLKEPWSALGMLNLILGICFLCYQIRINALDEGHKQGVKDVIEYMKKNKNN